MSGGDKLLVQLQQREIFKIKVAFLWTKEKKHCVDCLKNIIQNEVSSQLIINIQYKGFGKSNIDTFHLQYNYCGFRKRVSMGKLHTNSKEYIVTEQCLSFVLLLAEMHFIFCFIDELLNILYICDYVFLEDS